ncbi:MAG: hypothetical protein HQ567_22765 [Candidatus Nealsonbacteria bacterium]|nr:hypothetical protein [Candidatus Nealsonbacteria bacterium]
MTKPPQPKRRWYQYSVRGLFVLMTLVAIACSWYTVEMQKAMKRRATIAEIYELGGCVWYYDARYPDTFEPPRWYSWLRKLHGEEHLGNARSVNFVGPKITDAGLVQLENLTDLEALNLWSTQITDAGLVHLKGMAKLERLILGQGTQITDVGLEYLKGLTNLKVLWVCDADITDAGLVHLKGLTNLESLVLTNTQITEVGLEHLKGLKNLKELGLQRTRVMDAGMEHLKGLTNLETLNVRNTLVTEKGVENLQQASPNCTITLLTESQRMSKAPSQIRDFKKLGRSFRKRASGADEASGPTEGPARSEPR